MNLLSRHAVMEYLISLKNNDSLLANNSFKEALNNKGLSTLKVTSLLSARRHFVYQFKLAGKTYILKQFIKKKEDEQRADTNIVLNYFEIECQILQNNWDFIIPSAFIDKQNKIIIQEYFTKRDLNYILKRVRKDSKTSCSILKAIAAKIKVVHQKANSIVPPFMTGSLKVNTHVLDYYKHYVNSWEGTHFIHGDLMGRNILFKKQEDEDDYNNLRIIDWELSGIGDIYFDLSAIVTTLCLDRVGIMFFETFDNSVPADQYSKLRESINCFLEAYEQGGDKINRHKLKTFLIINTQHLSDNIENLIKNINQVFPSLPCKHN